MSRHRNIRSMRYSDEYDGYDDVYGHSVEEDDNLSPSDAAFMYDRSNHQHQLSSLIPTEDDITEEDESFCEENFSANLSDEEKAKLLSCLDEIRNVIGESIPESDMVRAIKESNYEVTVALDKLLTNSTSSKNNTNAEGPKPQRASLRQRGKGGIPRGVKNNGKIPLPFENNNGGTNQYEVFDVVSFLKSDKSSVHLDLNQAIIMTEIEPVCRPEKVALEKPMAKLLLKQQTTSTYFERTQSMFVLRPMSVKELNVDKPSKLGYFLCKKLREVNSHCYFSFQTVPSTSKLKPFKFDCKSPDDIGLTHRKWTHY